MHIQPIFLIVLLVFKMAQLKHYKKVAPNDLFVGILIVYLLIQSLTSNTKEFHTPGATDNLIDPQAWTNLHTLLRDLYKSGTLTIPGNVHIRGDLLVGTYKGGGNDGTDWEKSKANAACWRDSAGEEHQPPEVGTGGIYAWTAAHQETLTTFIYRAQPDNAYLEDHIWFCSRNEFLTKDASEREMQKIKCGDLEIRPGKAIYTDRIASAGSGWIRSYSNFVINEGKALQMDSGTHLEVLGSMRLKKIEELGISKEGAAPLGASFPGWKGYVMSFVLNGTNYGLKCYNDEGGAPIQL
jgi:hypothetical protein